MLQEDNEEKAVRIYAAGVYDMFHYGHAKQLEQAKKLFPNTYLIVGVCGQEAVLKFKGETVMTDIQRIEGPKHCKWVDEVIYPGPWIIDEKFLLDNKIDYVAHDDLPQVCANAVSTFSICKRLGKFKATKRTDGVSTSELINKILVDRNAYVKRNIDRGYTRQELGLSLIEFWMFKLDVCVKKVLCPSKKKKE